MEQEEAAIARQRHSKHVSAATNEHAIVELLETVFYGFQRSVCVRLYNKIVQATRGHTKS
jgi:hypothetical protein